MDLILMTTCQARLGLKWIQDVQPNTADSIQANIRSYQLEGCSTINAHGKTLNDTAKTNSNLFLWVRGEECRRPIPFSCPRLPVPFRLRILQMPGADCPIQCAFFACLESHHHQAKTETHCQHYVLGLKSLEGIILHSGHIEEEGYKIKHCIQVNKQNRIEKNPVFSPRKPSNFLQHFFFLWRSNKQF